MDFFKIVKIRNNVQTFGIISLQLLFRSGFWLGIFLERGLLVASRPFSPTPSLFHPLPLPLSYFSHPKRKRGLGWRFDSAPHSPLATSLIPLKFMLRSQLLLTLNSKNVRRFGLPQLRIWVSTNKCTSNRYFEKTNEIKRIHCELINKM